jgi:hypothetical protein
MFIITSHAASIGLAGRMRCVGRSVRTLGAWSVGAASTSERFLFCENICRNDVSADAVARLLQWGEDPRKQWKRH